MRISVTLQVCLQFPLPLPKYFFDWKFDRRTHIYKLLYKQEGQHNKYHWGIENSLQETSFDAEIINIIPTPAVYWILKQKVWLNLLEKKTNYEFFNK